MAKNPSLSRQYHQVKKNFKQTSDYIHLSYSERLNFILEIAKLIGSWSYCRLFAECIDKLYFDPKKTKMTVDVQAFEQLVSRFEQYLQIYSKSSKSVQFGILVHDNNPTVSKKHTELMKHFHKVGTFWTSINNIIDTPLYVDSQLTSMVQLADVCAFALRRYLENGETLLFNEIFKIADSKDGKIVGVRHYTDDKCDCLICKGHKRI